jgi:DNA-binding transcriptional ArsR family regulator
MAEIAPFRLPDTPGRSDLVAKYFRALGDPTRLRILELLQAEGELSAGS